MRAMDAQELIWRSRHMVRARMPAAPKASNAAALRSGSLSEDWADALASFRNGVDRPVFLDRARAQAISSQHPRYVAEVVDAANRAADLTIWFPGYPEVTLPRPLDWNYDPITNIRYPTIPSGRIDYRTLPGDVAWNWRLNRLQHLPWLAQAWLFTGDEHYAQTAFEHLDSWIEQNPPGRGVAWSGSFEAGLRAIAICVALQGFRDASELTPERFRRIVGVLAEIAHRCWPDRSLYSSANNHLIGEMAGLAVVAIMFPELRKAALWERRAIRTLSDEASRQVLPDGMSAEQSICYQMFTAELLHLVTVLLVDRDGSAPDQLVDTLARSSSFLGAVLGDGDPAPRYGDDDEGFALRLGSQSARNLQDHLGIMAASGFGTADITAGADSVDAQWFRALAAAAPAAPATSSSAPAHPPSFFAPEGGLVVLRQASRRITMDVGFLGYLSTAAHGHADALSVTVSEDGQYLIGDPGTGSFYGDPAWRTAARSTRAHATVCVDGQDQSVAAGRYLWTQHARVTTLGVDLDAGVVDARHDGYARLRGEVVHRRWLIAPRAHTMQLVVDLITGTGRHSCEQNWPLHPSLDIESTADGHLLSRAGLAVARLHYAASLPVTVDAVRGDEQANTGWWSDPAAGRSPAWWLSAHCSGELPAVMVTLIAPADGVAVEDLSVALSETAIEVQWTEDGRGRNTTVDVTRSATVATDSSVPGGSSL